MAVDDKKKTAPDTKEEDFRFDDGACSAEFGSAGCTEPDDK